MKKLLIFLIAIPGLSLFMSCQKWVDVGSPGTQLSAEKIFQSDATAISSVLAIYSQMETDGLNYNLIIHTGRSADELLNHSTSATNIELYTNNLTPGNSAVRNFWQVLYKYIYQANTLLEGLAMTPKVSEPVSRQLKGEAHFIRAFCYFYLVNLFGDAPLILSTSYEDAASRPRNNAGEVYSFIKEELTIATALLSSDYLSGAHTPTAERVRPNRFAAHALLARVHLYLSEWDRAEAEATIVLNNTNQYTLLSDPNEVFLKNSREAIWQWQSQLPNRNTYAGAFLILTTRPSNISIDSNVVNSFSMDDLRKANWIRSITSSGLHYYYPYKYKVRQNAPAITEYTMVLRLSEQLLIRSEAIAMQDRTDEALADLNAVRSRAGLSPLSGLSQSTLLDSIAQERRWELFTEFGDRWLNLKRTGTATPVLSVVKGANWADTDVLYPIPLSEIQLNSQLSQNAGY
ncbi:MAG TPA: RagB/SusD family nutrient uptake outer membrane protein [Chitinophagaceae bacterium]|nr:RagB/SusD family nutrient uptake outer membrane protein [Chitinophagaceae bacterium]